MLCLVLMLHFCAEHCEHAHMRVSVRAFRALVCRRMCNSVCVYGWYAALNQTSIQLITFSLMQNCC